MDQDKLDFLTKTLAAQTADDPRARPIARQRLAALARNPAGMTPGEMAALLISPSVRAAYIALRTAPAVPANDDYVFGASSFAARDGEPGPFTISAPFGTLAVRPGPDAEVPFVMVLTLDPAVPGGVAARHVTAWEMRSNQVWLDGLTDDAGQLMAPWPLGEALPQDRLNVDTLCFALAEDPVP